MFDRFVAPDYSPAGAKESAHTARRFLPGRPSGRHVVVVKGGGRLVGTLDLREVAGWTAREGPFRACGTARAPGRPCLLSCRHSPENDYRAVGGLSWSYSQEVGTYPPDGIRTPGVSAVKQKIQLTEEKETLLVPLLRKLWRGGGEIRYWQTARRRTSSATWSTTSRS